MSEPSYQELLRDPRWQKKRLEVMKRDGFMCRECESKEKTLNVHHTYYLKGVKPWEYPDASLRCLCEACHEVAQELYDRIRISLGWISMDDTFRLLGYSYGLFLLHDPTGMLKRPEGEYCYEVYSGICDAADAWLILQDFAKKDCALVNKEGWIHSKLVREVIERRKKEWREEQEKETGPVPKKEPVTSLLTPVVYQRSPWVVS